MRPNASSLPRPFPGAPRRKRPRTGRRVSEALPELAGVGLGGFFIGIVTSIPDGGLDGRVVLISAAVGLLGSAMVAFAMVVIGWLAGLETREDREETRRDPVVEQLVRDIRRALDESPLNPDRRNDPR